jgi:hypothetical protein
MVVWDQYDSLTLSLGIDRPAELEQPLTHLKGVVLCIPIKVQLVPYPVPRAEVLLLESKHKQRIQGVHNRVPHAAHV